MTFLICRTHMQDLKDITNNVHYENFRYKRLSSSTSKKGNEDKYVFTKYYLIINTN